MERKSLWTTHPTREKIKQYFVEQSKANRKCPLSRQWLLPPEPGLGFAKQRNSGKLWSIYLATIPIRL
jgi:hypothetical protein